MTLLRLIASIALACMALPAFGQTCPAAPADPIARDAVRLNWNAVTTWVVPPGGNIPTPTQVVYTVYRMASALPNAVATKVCETSSLSAGQTGLPVGDVCYAVTAKTPLSTPPNTESARTATVCKTIPAQPTTPSVPGGFTITGTIEFNLAVTPNP